jgi:hypothetical protein
VAPTFGELHLAAQKSHNNNQQISIWQTDRQTNSFIFIYRIFKDEWSRRNYGDFKEADDFENVDNKPLIVDK